MQVTAELDSPGIERRMAVVELQNVKKTEINLPFITATKNGPLHYQRAVDDKAMKMLYAAAKKLG